MAYYIDNINKENKKCKVCGRKLNDRYNNDTCLPCKMKGE